MHGGSRAIAHLVGRLAERHEIALLCLRRSSEPPVDELLARKLVHVDEVLHRTEDSPHRIRELVRDYIGLLSGTPSWVRATRSAEFARRAQEKIATWRPHVVQLEYPVMGQYVEALRDSPAARVLVEHDFAVAAARELLPRRRGPARIRAWAELVAWNRFERRLFQRVAAVVVFTDRDAAAARELRAAEVFVVPLGTDVPPSPLDSAGASPASLAFVGSFVHEPNVDAALRLARGIFPPLRERFADLRLELVGHDPPAEVRALAGPSVRVHADVPDVAPYLDGASVVVVPLRLGGGMRLKVLEALAAGKAIVASPRALAGIDAVPGEHLLVAETDEEFIDAIASLIVDRTRRVTLGREAHQWARENLSWDRSAADFERLYDAVSPVAHSAGTT